MDLIGRYLFRQTAGALLMILITLTLILWLSSALKQLSLMTSQGQGLMVFLKITSLAIPNLIAVVAPVALLIACLHTLNRINGDSELIVLNAAGASVWRVLRPYLLLGVLVMLFTLAVNAYFLPQSMRLLKEYITQVRADIISQVLQPGQFSSADKGLTFHIRDRENDGRLLGLVVHDERDAKRVMTYLADHGRIVEQDGKAFLIMYEGHIHRQQGDDPAVNIVTFDSYLFDLSQLTAANAKSASSEPDYKPRELFLHELIYPNVNSVEYRKNRGKFKAELHERLSNPLYPILFVLIAVLHLGYARTTREGRVESLVMAFTVAALFRVAGLTLTNLAAKQSWAIFAMYGLPLAGIIGVLLMLAFNIRPLSFPRISLTVPSLPFRRKNDNDVRQLARSGNSPARP
ncbi:MAG: LPS export ABC transporter permease LptF [Hyphomicrobiales bacterium]|nr:LPS export ABC transporter permease LptF [Hyphomicrobiales bacterium]